MTKNSATRALSMVVAIVMSMAGACSNQGSQKVPFRQANDQLSGELRVSGSGTMAPMISEMAKQFQASNPDVTFDIRTGGSGRGLSDPMEGKSDVGMVAGTVSIEERELVPFLIARDGIVLVIREDNPITTLSDQQIADIFTKKITNWHQVGGSDGHPYLVTASAEAGSTEVFLRYFRLKYPELQTDLMANTDMDVFEALSKNRGAIAYVSLGEAERRSSAGDKIKLLPISGVAATADNLSAGRYRLGRPLGLVTHGLPSGAAKAFIDHARSAAAIPLIVRFQFVPYRD